MPDRPPEPRATSPEPAGGDRPRSRGRGDSNGRGHVERSSAARELLRFLPDVGRLLYDVSRDHRVPLSVKVRSGAAAAYVFSPIDIIPDFIPGIGQMDDVAVVVWAVRNLLRHAGYDVLKDLWKGTDDGFALLLVVAGIDR